MEDPRGRRLRRRTRSRCAAPSASPIDVDQEIRLYWRGQAVPAQSGLMPQHDGLRPGVRERQPHATTWRAPRRCSTLYGYVDRDGDGWREQPDGSPLVLEWATTPDQRARQRDELRRKDLNALGIRIDFKSAKWPENLKNARAGKLMIWSLGSSAASPDGRLVVRPRRHQPQRRPEPFALQPEAVR